MQIWAHWAAMFSFNSSYKNFVGSK